VVTATLGTSTKSVIFTVSTNTSQSRVGSLQCDPDGLSAGGSALCTVALQDVDPLSTATVTLSSSVESVKLPASITTRPGQSSIDFQIDATSADAASAVITAETESSSAQQTVKVRSEALRAPERQFARVDHALQFQVSAADSSAIATLGQLPAGARFAAGVFEWTPNSAQIGDYEVAFAATVDGRPTTRRVPIAVESGAPVIEAAVNAASRSAQSACSPGAIASLRGRWLDGAVVRINGERARVLAAAETRVDFLCPNAIAGSQLEIVAETAAGVSAPASVQSQETTPGLFSADGSGSGEGMVMHAGSSAFTGVRKYASTALPAAPGDMLVAYATGVDNAVRLKAIVGGVEVTPDAVTPVDGAPGLFRVSLTVPVQIVPASRIAVSLQCDSASGTSRKSNEVWIAVESGERARFTR
jgi:uncharacterized protein (TIGR03437 family)